MRYRARRKIPLLELPAEKISPDRAHPKEWGEVCDRHRHRYRNSDRLVFLLPDRTTSHADSVEFASYRLMNRKALILIEEAIPMHLCKAAYLARQRSNFPRQFCMIAEIFLTPSRTRGPG
jgi:hypothetical protein